MDVREYLLSQIPPEYIKKWNLDKCFEESSPTKAIDPSANVSNVPVHTNFRLPISYLEPSQVHPLSPIVAQDLELTIPGSEQSMYQHLFRPTTKFGRNLIPLWSQNFTTNTQFLEETQQLISKFHGQDFDHAGTESVEYDKFREIWRDIKEDAFFLEKYGYMEWSMLLYLNENASFLQCLSFINVVSPLVSLFLPLIFIILPFIILKIQRIPINFTVYLEVLASIAKNHFIGKALTTLSSFSWDKLAYFFLTAGLYFLQIYQNVLTCYRFYRNMMLVNNHLVGMRQFVNRSIRQMNVLQDIIRVLPTYHGFGADVALHCATLMRLDSELSKIYPFQSSLRKFGESGYMLRTYYRLFSDPDYEAALRYAAGFEGYVENLRGICCNIREGKMTLASFTVDVSGCTLVEQCYPPLLSDTDQVTRNTVDLNKNIILSGPNRSGKTTVLKTTVLNLIFSQQVGCGFYTSARICPYSHIHSYLNIPDTSGRDSLFQAESRRCKEILDTIKKAPTGSRHFCIFDELYSGTNPDEASKAGHAFLKYLNEFTHVDFMLTTHYVKICKKFVKSERVENYKMYVRALGQDGYDYTYRMVRGISKIKGAAQVMKDMDYPDEIIREMA